MSDSHRGAFLTGFLIGGLAGAAAALLMTPQTGDKTRIQLQAKGVELKSQAEGVAADLQSRAQVLVDEKTPMGGVARTDEAIEIPAEEVEPAEDDEAAA